MSEYSQPNNVLNPLNTFNYLPGYAAFIQAFVGAYCGLRVRDFQLDLVYPSDSFTQYQSSSSSTQYPIFKPPTTNTESWNITGLSYRGHKLDIIYNLRTKAVEIRNRRSTEQTNAEDNLEVLVYEGTEPVVKPLKIGNVVTISLTTESWINDAKKSRLQTSNSYSDNMHILASIYSTQFTNNIVKAKNSGLNLTGSNIILLISLLSSYFIRLF